MTPAEKTLLILGCGSEIASIDVAIKLIERSAVKKYTRRLEDQENFIDIDDFDLASEQRDDKGVRRYSVKNSVDGFVMVPDADGFWSPYSEVK